MERMRRGWGGERVRLKERQLKVKYVCTETIVAVKSSVSYYFIDEKVCPYAFHLTDVVTVTRVTLHPTLERFFSYFR
jgi:hypothetical protein